MKQTGKFHVYEIKDDKRVVSAIANATLYFLDVNDQEQFKLTTKTDNEGNFNFDLALGEYVVLATAGDGLEQVLANGSTFVLTAQSKVSAFEEWLNRPGESVDSSLLAKFRELMQRTETAATSIDPKLALKRDLNNNKFDYKIAVRNIHQSDNFGVTYEEDGKLITFLSYNKNEESLYVHYYSDKGWIQGGSIALTEYKQAPLSFSGSGKVVRESSLNPYMKIGAGGFLGIPILRNLGEQLDLRSEFVAGNGKGGGWANWGRGVSCSADNGYTAIIGTSVDLGVIHYDGWTNSHVSFKALTERNTSIDTNGFIKRASPIVDLYANHIEHNDQFDEAPIFKKLGIGHYKISGTLGLAKGLEAGDWYIETPKDKNGERYFNTEWQQLEDNTVIIRTYEREAFTEEYERYDESGEVLKDPSGNTLKFYKRHEINGDPIDIIENRFISLRFYEELKEYEAPAVHEESEEDRKAREEQQTIEAREQEIAELKRNRTLKSNEALVMKDIDESVYLELIEEVKEINARLRSM